uniref:hydroxyacid oxidase 1-like n=1 Tax=Styela clava TaxID=7725 RepID=UPI00193AC510|nr:hydroxyacid oxidase 1-like [Styela clava]
MAAKLLPKGLLNFVGFGETDSRTLVKKLSGFDSWRFQQRVLRDVSRVDTSSSMLGSNISFPVCVAPFGLQKMPSQRGEIDSAKAAENAGTGFAMSFWSSCTIEEVAKAVPNVLRWFQLYITKDRLVSKNLVQRAKRNGYSAIIVTVDYVVQGKEYVNLYNDIAASPSLATKSIEENFYKVFFEGMDVYDLSMEPIDNLEGY